MLRVRDPQKSLEYYKFLGMTQVNKLSYPENKFDLYFLGTSFVSDVRRDTAQVSGQGLTYSSIRWKGVCVIRSPLERPRRGVGAYAQLRNCQSLIAF
jgi:hypothetical protein